ncbi:hypothetical protein [Enterococcus sp. DIV0876]|uniref:hypothetical protein n=1 Tax=Enterococcus sp. DIV0876 TaxID=2774633 RepID=UPI003D2FB0FF
MEYKLFTTLYREAHEYSSVDMYIADRGWQDWMNDFEDAGAALALIYDLATNDFATNRKRITDNRTEFSRLYNIRLRTVENWELSVTKTPDHVKELVDYTIYEKEYK